MQLDVIVVGAGLAGLASANGLRRAGHRVRIFEKSMFARDIGAGISVTPNGSRILRKWGFDFEDARATVMRETKIINGATMETIVSTPLNPGPEPYSFQLYRPDYHAQLLKLATFEDGEGPVATLTLGAEVIGADAESGTIYLADGTSHSADLVIGADGIHSILRKIVAPGEPAITHSRSNAFRFMGDTKDLQADPETKALWEKNQNTWKGVAVNGMKWFLVWYDLREGQLQNFALGFPSGDAPLAELGTTEAEIKASLLKEVQNFHPTMQKVMGIARNITPWHVHVHESLSTWIKGKLLLIGDSAHPLFPVYSQGVNTSVEDAAALQILLSNIKDLSELPKRLQAVEEIRLPRTAIVQYLSALALGPQPSFAARIDPYLKEYSPIVSRAETQNFIWRDVNHHLSCSS